MKPILNFESMLDRYNRSDFGQVYDTLKRRFGKDPNEYEVIKEIARINGEMAGLPANNTAKDRMSLFSENPIFTYHWTPGEFGDFVKREINDSDNSEALIWDALGVHSGTLQAAYDRFNDTYNYSLDDLKHAIETDTLPNYLKTGTYRPLVIDGDKPYLVNGAIEHEYKSGGIGLQDQIEKFRDDYLKRDFGITDLLDEEPENYRRYQNYALDEIRSNIFDKAGHTTIPYINASEDAGSVSHMTSHTNLKSPHAMFDPRQFRSGNLLDAVLAAPMPAMLDPAVTKKNNETARQAFDFATGFVPVLGPARDAARDFTKGDYGWAAVNAAMAAAEMGIPLLAGVKVLKPALMKGLSYLK